MLHFNSTLNSTLYASHSSLYTLHSALYTLHLKRCTLYSTLSTLHSTLYTLHSTPHTLHFTLHTLHSTLHILHFTPHPHFILYTPHSTLYTLHPTLYTFHSTLQFFLLHALRFTLHALHSLFLLPQLWFRGSLSYVWAFGFADFILFKLFLRFLMIHDSWLEPNNNVGRCFYGLVTLQSVQNFTVHSGRFSSLGWVEGRIIRFSQKLSWIGIASVGFEWHTG